MCTMREGETSAQESMMHADFIEIVLLVSVWWVRFGIRPNSCNNIVTVCNNILIHDLIITENK